MVLVCCLILSYGYFIGRFSLEVNKIGYHNDKIPDAFHGYRIVHISDLHLSTFSDRPKALKKIIDKINSLNPDLICFTGDLVSLGTEEAYSFTSILSTLKATDGIASVLGNHDFLIYNQHYSDDAQREAAVLKLVEYQRDILGWKLLRNEHFSISRGDATMNIIGVDNMNCSGQGFATINRGDLKKAMEGVDTSSFSILLSHDPSHWSSEVIPDTDIPLTLSGHTHAAQFRIFGWTPASLMFREVQGRYDSNQQTLYINRGLGCTIPIRLNCPEEITLITLE